eukprot:2416240-Rhodomonas_salina.1
MPQQQQAADRRVQVHSQTMNTHGRMPMPLANSWMTHNGDAQTHSASEMTDPRDVLTNSTSRHPHVSLHPRSQAPVPGMPTNQQLHDHPGMQMSQASAHPGAKTKRNPNGEIAEHWDGKSMSPIGADIDGK